MKKKMNAFTLIELLAVIVILAIIALIATPIILGIVEDAKKDAFLRSVELVISTTDIDITSKTFEEEYTYTITDGDISNLEVGVKNTNGMNGSIKYDINGNESYAVHNGVYCVVKTFGSSKAEIKDYDGNCNFIVEQSTNGCFAFSNGTITDYFEYENNNSNNSKCPTNVEVPETINGELVTVIGESAFEAYCDWDEDDNYFCEGQIESLKLPSSIKIIEDSAFRYSKLSGELDLSNTNITEIGEYAFASQSCNYNEDWEFVCDGITNIVLPNSIEKIENYAFERNAFSGLLDLSAYTNLTYLSGFSENSIATIKLPSSTKTIGEYAFAHNNLSGELNLSYLANLTNIDSDAFRGSSWGEVLNQITSVILPSSLEYIGDGAFAYNAFNSELDLSNLINLLNIGEEAFALDINESDFQVTKLKLPSNLESIGRAAFYGNKISGELDLSNLTKLKTIGEYAFAENNITGELNLSNTQLSSISDYAFWGGFYGDANQITTLKLPSTLESIGERAFEENQISGELDLSTLTKLTSISGFQSNQITSIKLPLNLENIGDSAFQWNKLNGELDLSSTKLTSIGESAFGSSVNKSYNQITSVKFPDTLETIGEQAFYYNNISGELDLDNLTNLTSIGDRAFEGNGITHVIFATNINAINGFEYNNISGELDLSMYTNLKSVSGFGYNEITSIKLPISIESIEFNAFADNKLSGELDLSDLTNLNSIGPSAFEGNYDYDEDWNEIPTGKITSIKFPSGITSIEDTAFYNNVLTSVIFYGITNLDDIYIGEDVWGWAEGYDESNITFQP